MEVNVHVQHQVNVKDRFRKHGGNAALLLYRLDAGAEEPFCCLWYYITGRSVGCNEDRRPVFFRFDPRVHRCAKWFVDRSVQRQVLRSSKARMQMAFTNHHGVGTATYSISNCLQYPLNWSHRGRLKNLGRLASSMVIHVRLSCIRIVSIFVKL